MNTEAESQQFRLECFARAMIAQHCKNCEAWEVRAVMRNWLRGREKKQGVDEQLRAVMKQEIEKHESNSALENQIQRNVDDVDLKRELAR